MDETLVQPDATPSDVAPAQPDVAPVVEAPVADAPAVETPVAPPAIEIPVETPAVEPMPAVETASAVESAPVEEVPAPAPVVEAPTEAVATPVVVQSPVIAAELWEDVEILSKSWYSEPVDEINPELVGNFVDLVLADGTTRRIPKADILSAGLSLPL